MELGEWFPQKAIAATKTTNSATPMQPFRLPLDRVTGAAGLAGGCAGNGCDCCIGTQRVPSQ